jgi:hypothetical protein
MSGGKEWEIRVDPSGKLISKKVESADEEKHEKKKGEKEEDEKDEKK